jgi:hypothetical protein
MAQEQKTFIIFGKKRNVLKAENVWAGRRNGQLDLNPVLLPDGLQRKPILNERELSLAGFVDVTPVCAVCKGGHGNHIGDCRLKTIPTTSASRKVAKQRNLFEYGSNTVSKRAQIVATEAASRVSSDVHVDIATEMEILDAPTQEDNQVEVVPIDVEIEEQQTDEVEQSTEEELIMELEEGDIESGEADFKIEKTFHERLRKLAKLYFDKNVKKDLKENDATCVFPFPLAGRWRSKLEEFQWSPEAFVLSTCSLYVWDPLLLHKDLLGDLKLLCPNCNLPLKRNGYRLPKVERIISGTPRVLVSAALKCKDCKNSDKDSSSSNFAADDSKILKQLPDVSRLQFPFIVTQNGAFIAIDTLLQADALKVAGVSFESMQTASLVTVETKLIQCEMLRQHLRLQEHERSKENCDKGAVKTTLDRWMLPNEKQTPPKLSGNTVYFTPVFLLTAAIITRFFDDNAHRQQDTIEAWARESCTQTRSFAMDHQFEWGNKGSEEGAVGILSILTATGEVVGVRPVANKSMVAAEGLLTELGKIASEEGHAIKCIYTDNPDADRATLQRAFGADVQIKKDPFHLIEDLVDLCSKSSKLFTFWISALLAAVWSYVQEDIDRLRETLKLLNDPFMEEKLADPLFLQKQPSVRHFPRPPAQMQAALQRAYNAFMKLGCLKDEAETVVANAGKTIDKYMSEPEGVETHVNVGTEAKPVWRYMRGTNMVELFNRFIGNANIRRHGQRLAHSIILRLAYCFSHTQRINFRKMNLLKGLTDPTIQNDYIAIQKKLLAQGLLESDAVLFKQVPFVKPLENPSEYLIGITQPLGSIVAAAADYLETGYKSQFPSRISNSLPIRDEKIIISKLQQPAKKFDNANEKHLLTLMLSNPNYYNQVGRDKVFKIGSVDLNRLFECACDTNLDENVSIDAMIEIEFLTLDWNIKFLSENDEEWNIEYEGFCISSRYVKPKELKHMKDELARRSVSAAKSLLDAESEKATRNVARMGTVPIGRLAELPQTYPIDENERAVVGTAAPPSLPNVSPASVNHSIAKRSRKKETVPQASASSEELCDECKKVTRHHAPVTCPKALWEKDFTSTIPRKGKEGRNDAAERVWPSVRHHFAVDEKYFRLPDWTYKGPPS